MNNYINKFSCWYTEQRNYFVRSTSVGSHLIILRLANRVGRDQAALTRAAGSGSVLFAKVLKGISMR